MSGKHLFAPAEWVEMTDLGAQVAGLVCECAGWCGNPHNPGGRCEQFPAVHPAPRGSSRPGVELPVAMVCGGCAESGRTRDLPDVELRDELLDIDTACRVDPELFTGPDEGETGENRAAREAAAIDMCGECPARVLCAEYAYRIRPKVGIWAGRPAEHYTAAPARPGGIDEHVRSAA